MRLQSPDAAAGAVTAILVAAARLGQLGRQEQPERRGQQEPPGRRAAPACRRRRRRFNRSPSRDTKISRTETHLAQAILTNPRVVLVCVGVAVAAFAGYSLRLFSQDEPPSALSAGGLLNATQQITLEADDVQVIGRSAGKVRWRMAAQTVALSRDRSTITVQGIHKGALYSAGSRPSVSLTADHASYSTPFGVLGASGLGSLRVDGNVTAVVLSAEHPSVRTQSLVWDSASNALVCPLPVTAALPKLRVTAGSARYDSPPGVPERGVMRLGGGVHARFDSTHGLVTADCPGLTWDAAGQDAQTTGPVQVAIPGGLGTASASQIEVNTGTGDLSCQELRGTLRLSPEVQ